MSAAVSAFSADAGAYDAPRRQLIPCFDAFYGTAAALLGPSLWPGAQRPAPQVVDLGAGTGLLAARVRQALPQARLHLIDASAEMLDVARERFRGDAAISFEVADLGTAALPAADAFVSALAIHHLPDAGKRRLFRRLFQALRPGGVFINLDQVAARTEAAASAQHSDWLRAVRTAGATEPALRQALARMALDRNAGAAEQLAWLDEAGFSDAEIWFRQWFFAVFHGRRDG